MCVRMHIVCVCVCVCLPKHGQNAAVVSWSKGCVLCRTEQRSGRLCQTQAQQSLSLVVVVFSVHTVGGCSRKKGRGSVREIVCPMCLGPVGWI